MNSPFHFGSTVSKKYFTNRRKEIDRLYSNLLNGINTAIISPRRWGKSSLVDYVSLKIKKEKKEYKQVHIDLFSIQSEGEFLSLFAKLCIKASENKWDEWAKTAKDVFKSLVPKFIVSTDFGDFTLEFDNKDIVTHKEEILNLPETLGKKKKVKFLVFIDEFQNIRNYTDGENIEKSMRSYWQRHESVVYCLYGSKKHMMTEIFNNPARPFYRFGDIMLLDKIHKEDWISFIVQSFSSTKKQISEKNAGIIAEKMQFHSWYVQQLAHYTWVMTEKEVTATTIDEAMEDILNAQFPFFQILVENLSVTQINLLRAVGNAEHQYTSTGVMQKYSLGTPNNVRKNIQILIDKDILDSRQSSLYFLDPVIEIWFKRRFLNL